MKTKKLVLACALMAPALVLADSGNAWYINPQVGANLPDYKRDLKSSDWLYGFGIGRELGPVFNLELNADAARIGNGLGTAHLNTFDYSLDLLAILHRQNTFAPYLTVGAGAARDVWHVNGVGSARDNNFMAQAGLGVMWRLWQNDSGTSSLSLRPEIKARWDDPTGDNHFVDAIATVGLQYAFGGSAAAPAPQPPPPPPPAPVEAAPPPAPPPPAPVEPLDSDHDGVPDNIDRCPNTPAGVEVDATGCPLKGSITLKGVNFEFNSAMLTGDSDAVLDPVAQGLAKHPRVRVELQGYTDSVGSDAYNLKLSQRRADSVRDYLVAHGVQSDQLKSHGFGESDPVASNRTADGRAENRRVVMSVLSNPGDVTIKDGAAGE